MIADVASRPRARPRLPLGGIAAFTVATLFLAGAVHICTILLVPVLSRSDGWSHLDAIAGEEQFSEIPPDDPTSGMLGLDPLFQNGACRIRLQNAPAAIATEPRDRFWSLAVYDPRGTVIFSLNDRTAVEGRLDMLIVSASQNAALQKTSPGSADQRIVVESRSEDLIALLRLFAPTETARAEARRVMAESECYAEPLPEPSAASG